MASDILNFPYLTRPQQASPVNAPMPFQIQPIDAFGPDGNMAAAQPAQGLIPGIKSLDQMDAPAAGGVKLPGTDLPFPYQPVESFGSPAVSTADANTSQFLPPEAFGSAPLANTPPTGGSRVLSPDELHQRDLGHSEYLQKSGSGIDQIFRPVDSFGDPTHAPVSFGRKVGGGVLRALDIAGSVLPITRNIEAAIPGTEERHQLLEAQANRAVDRDQAQEMSAAQLAHLQAETDATNQGIEAGDAAARRAALSGTILYDENKHPIGYQDPTGRMYGSKDPALPQNVRDVLGEVTGKQPTTPLELALRDNPNMTAREWNDQQQHPITAQEAKGLNGTWDGLGSKHGLPTGQFTAGMARADATALATSLNNALGKQQGDTHITITQQGQAQRTAQLAKKNGALDLSSPESQTAIQSLANGDLGLNEVLPRGATFGQRAAVVAAAKAVNPEYNSGDHAVENGVRRYMTSGQGGSTLTAGNTLNHHLDLYDKAVDAVHNGNSKLVNSIGNELGVQTGNDAQTNLNLIRQGVAMEAARFYTGGIPGEKEIDQFNSSLSGDGSPKQMHGGAATVRSMAQGKLQGLKDQASAGSKGQANFGGNGNVSAPTSYAMMATGAGGHRIGSNDGGTTWFDVQTGKKAE